MVLIGLRQVRQMSKDPIKQSRLYWWRGNRRKLTSGLKQLEQLPGQPSYRTRRHGDDDIGQRHASE